MRPAPAAIVGFSGLLVAPERLAAERGGDVPVLLIHGTDDDIVPFAMLGQALAGLRQAGIGAESLACPGLGHAIDPDGLDAAAAFLAHHLGQG